RRLEDGVDGGAIDALAGKGAIQVDHVQPLEPLVLEGLRLGGGVRIVDGGLFHVAELEAHALAVLEVDGGKEDHVVCPSAAWAFKASSAGNWQSGRGRESGSFPDGTGLRPCCRVRRRPSSARRNGWSR